MNNSFKMWKKDFFHNIKTTFNKFFQKENIYIINVDWEEYKVTKDLNDIKNSTDMKKFLDKKTIEIICKSKKNICKQSWLNFLPSMSRDQKDILLNKLLESII